MVRKRPLIERNSQAIEERKAFPHQAKLWTDTEVCMHDEAYCQPKMKLGKFLVDLNARGDIDEDELEEVAGTRPLVEFDAGGKHEPKIFLFGAVTCPKTLEIDGVTYIDPSFDGKILLARVRGKAARKVNRNGRLKGELRYENVTIDGLRYKEIFEMDGGYLCAIKQYMNPLLRPPDYKTARVLCIDLDKEKADEDKINNGQAAPVRRWVSDPAPTSS